jgi:hypothetical protein
MPTFRKRKQHNVNDRKSDPGVANFTTNEEHAATTPDTIITSQPATKHPRLETLPALESLPPKALQEVLRFIGSPRKIFTLVTHIKAFHQVVSLEIVVEAAFLDGRKSRRIVTSIVEQIKAKQIHVPSTTRLLRLLTLKRCERGEECCGFNLETKVPRQLDDVVSAKRNRTNHSLRICDDCFDFLMTDAFSKNCHWALRNYIKNKTGIAIPRETVVDCATGEKVGPRFLSKDLLQFNSSHFEKGYYSNEMDATETALNALLDELPDDYEDIQLRRYEILKTHRELCLGEDTKQRIEQERREEMRLKRQEKSEAIIQELKSQFGELVRTYPFLFEFTFEYNGSASFETGFMDDILGPVVRNTSKKISKPKLAMAIESVVNMIIHLENQTILGKTPFSFLDSSDTTQAALCKYFSYFPLSFFLNRQEWRLKGKERREIDGYADLIVNGETLEALSSILLDTTAGCGTAYCYPNYREFFRSSMLAESNILPSNEIETKRYTSLALAVLNESDQHSHRRQGEAYSQLKERFLRMRLRFHQLLALIRTYKELPATARFLEQRNPWSTYTPAMAVDTIFEMKGTERVMLEEKNFEGLLRHHRQWYKICDGYHD